MLIRRIEKWGWFVRGWAEEVHADPDLSCACALVSTRLHHCLQADGLDAKVIVKPIYDVNGLARHAFVLCGDWLVDVTATQFGPGYRKVEIHPYPCSYDIWSEPLIAELETEEEIDAYFQDWPREQRPSTAQRRPPLGPTH